MKLPKHSSIEMRNSMTEIIERVNILPSVGSLYNSRNMAYEHHFALAEFVDNSIQSFVENEEEIKSIEGEDFRPEIIIDFGDDTILISDNSGGINTENYHRAFRSGVRPNNTDGLSEFGEGMKNAACWYANNWEVKTSALNESIERIVKFDMDEILKNNTEFLDVEQIDAKKDKHGTEIKLYNLLQKPLGPGHTKIQEYLSGIYRLHLKDNRIVLRCKGKTYDKTLSFFDVSTPDILFAAHHGHPEAYNPNASRDNHKEWKLDINLTLATGIRITGFAALAYPGESPGFGFSLFRRGRLITDNYKPYEIFRSPGHEIYQRLFGELHLDNVGVHFAKDQFNWTENEEKNILNSLKERLSPLLDQARKYKYEEHRKAFVDIDTDDTETTTPTEGTDTETTTPTEGTDTETTTPTEGTDTETTTPTEGTDTETTTPTEGTDTETTTPTEGTESTPDSRTIEEVTIDGETKQIYVDQHIVYFHQLPLGNVIKIGKTNVRRYDGRIAEAQRYFVDRVTLLGVIPCENQDAVDEKENELLTDFKVARSELVWDNDDVRMYIEDNCEDPRFYAEASRRSGS